MKNQQHEFNGGRSAIVLAYLPVNEAWTVYRQDGDIHGLQRIHATHNEALMDFDQRIDFIEQMEREA